MLLTNGRLNIEQLLAGNAAGKKVAKIAVGTSSVAETGAETTLTGMIAKTVSSVNYLSGGVVEFVSQLDAGDPSMTVAEMGLLDDSGRLVHRKVIAPFVRTTGLINNLVYRLKIR